MKIQIFKSFSLSFRRTDDPQEKKSTKFGQWAIYILGGIFKRAHQQISNFGFLYQIMLVLARYNSVHFLKLMYSSKPMCGRRYLYCFKGNKEVSCGKARSLATFFTFFTCQGTIWLSDTSSILYTQQYSLSILYSCRIQGHQFDEKTTLIGRQMGDSRGTSQWQMLSRSIRSITKKIKVRIKYNHKSSVTTL